MSDKKQNLGDPKQQFQKQYYRVRENQHRTNFKCCMRVKGLQIESYALLPENLRCLKSKGAKVK